MAARDANKVVRVGRLAAKPSSETLPGVHSPGLWLLERLHLEQFVRAGELDEALAVLRADMATAAAHSRVVCFLEQHGRTRGAFAQAEAAWKQYPDELSAEADMLRCFERDGWTDEAFALRHKQFVREPTVERYLGVVKVGAVASRPAQELRTALFDVLKAAESRAAAQQLAARTDGRRPSAWNASTVLLRSPSGAGVSLRASILCAESSWLDALAAVQPPAVCDDHVLQHIARNLPATHHTDAVRLLKQSFARVLAESSSPYRDALALVGEVVARSTNRERAGWLQALRVEYKAKRNFIRDLPVGFRGEGVEAP